MYVDRVHALLFHQLKEKHSQIRLNALRIYNCLFKYVYFFVFIFLIVYLVQVRTFINLC